MASNPPFFKCPFCGETKCEAPPSDASEDYMLKCAACGREVEPFGAVRTRAWEIAKANVLKKIRAKHN
jgi:transcription elongation factor Elf1